MLFGTVREGLRALALGVLLFSPTPPAPWLGVTALVAGASVVTAPSTVEARARARSSGGYARPGRSSSRTPSFGGARATTRTPSASGGYSRPYGSASGYASPRPSATNASPGDRALSRQQSGDALGRYREQQAEVPRPRVTTTPPASSGGGPGTFGGRADRGYRSGWFANRGWSAPGYAYRTQRSFGLWDGIFLWFLLDNLSRPGYGDFFHHHQNDPGYQQWRAEAEGLARENAQVRQQLDELDRQVAAKEGQPRDPNYLPADAPPEIAVALPENSRTPSPISPTGGEGPGGLGLPIVLLLGGISAMALLRRRQAAGRPATVGAGQVTAGPWQSARKILRHKLSGEAYAPSRFRVGMTLTLDPTPFILAVRATKVPVPDPGGGNLLVSVQAVGTLETGGASRLTRLYLDHESSFFQLHLAADGNPDECRFFGRIDEVSPADASEWALWIDPSEGMIGWPEFQTKDGKVYPRAWAPGTSRVAPRELTESVETLGGRRSVRRHAMLYAAPTGSPAPAPETEYILVAAVEADGQAWVEVHAGIDVNPAALSLA